MPPSGFIAFLMQLVVMSPAEWDREFVADFAAHGPRLCIADVMRIGRRRCTEKTWLCCNEAQMLFVSNPRRL